MADDLASQLADAIVTAAVRAAGNHSIFTISDARLHLADDLRRIMETTTLPEWYAGYEAGCREQERAAGGERSTTTSTSRSELAAHLRKIRLRYLDAPWDVADALYDAADALESIAASNEPDDYACPDYTPDERHRHTIGGQTWEHAHEGGHEAHSAVSHDLSGAALIGGEKSRYFVELLAAQTMARRILRAREAPTPGFRPMTITDFSDACAELCEYVLSLDGSGSMDAVALDRLAEMLRARVDLDGSDASDSVYAIVARTGRDVTPEGEED